MKKVISWQTWCLVGALLIVGVLFISSSMPYTDQTSVPFLEKYLPQKPFEAWLQQFSFVYAGKEISVTSVGYYKFLEFFIRKGAHFGTYFLLGSLTYLGLSRYLAKWWLGALSSWLLVTSYAGLDELHQMFTSERTPLVQDVILDSGGALCGIFVAVLLLAKVQKR